MYDYVIIAAGAAIKFLWEHQLPPLIYIRGQNLIYAMEEIDSTVNFDAHISGKYVVFDRVRNQVICGATFEYERDCDDLNEKGFDWI